MQRVTGTRQHRMLLFGVSLLLFFTAGCYAPLVSKAIPASTLPDQFRIPWRTGGPPLNLSTLTVQPPTDYFLGANDILEVTIPGLYDRSEVTPLRVQVMTNGQVHLPLVGPVSVQDMNLSQAQRAISAAYEGGFVVNPRINVALAEKGNTSVLVLGQVKQPGTFALPKYENDVGHAIGAAGGLTPDAADYLEVHRQVPAERVAPGPESLPYQDARQSSPRPSLVSNRLPPLQAVTTNASHYGMLNQANPPAPVQRMRGSVPQILRIPLRGFDVAAVSPRDVMLGPGDVVVVPDRRHEVFYVVGPLSTTNTVRFTVGDRERELGVGFVLPRDREIDVVTAVAMAGYIDPIYSPTTVIVQRLGPDSNPMLIHVDLIKARYDRLETILVQPGDIIYLNPDHEWWWRRFIDRVLVDGFRAPYAKIFR